MEFANFKALINEVHCGSGPPVGFTQEEFDSVRACIENVKPIEVDNVSIDINIDTSQMDCMSDGISQIQKIIEDQKTNVVVGMHQGILRQKVQELRDNLDIIKIYNDERHKFLTKLNQSSGSSANSAIQNIELFPIIAEETTILIQEVISKMSNQIIVTFWGINDSFPANIATFDLRLINLTQVTVSLINPSTNKMQPTNVAIFNSPHLTNNIFEGTQSFKLIDQTPYNSEAGNNPPIEESNYDSIPGLLYNGVGGSYLGLYHKLNNPLTYLFTIEERGLTLNSNLIDPKLKKIQDAPTSIKEGDITYYIADQAKYESFYSKLETEYQKRVDAERLTVYPKQSLPYINKIKELARREAANVYRAIGGTSGVLSFYTNSRFEINTLIEQCDTELANLSNKISENVMDEDTITKKVSDIACFTEAVQVANNLEANPTGEPGCENTTKEKLGTDPLYLRTLSEVNFGLPDIGSQCYWKEFAKALNRISLLPFPDISGPPPSNLVFRYWPINCILPAGPALALITVPPVWKPLFVIPTAVGTLILFLNLPIAPIGIPLPSLYLFYFAPDGTKYLALATNLPLLWSNTKNLIFGYELDTSSSSQNPLGLNPTNPYKGYPIKGAFTQPLAISAQTSKATRLTKLAIDIATGKQPTISNINGEKLPFNMSSADYSKYYLSEMEFMQNIVDANPADEFLRQVDTLKGTLNRQLDKLGDMQTDKINKLRSNQRNARKSALSEAEQENALDKKRKAKKVARSLNTISLQDKINSTVDAFNSYIDNIKFGTISFPKDATKNNPGIPEALTAIIDLITMASLGDMKIEESALSLNSKMKQAVARINKSAAITANTFDLKTNKGMADLKDSLNNMVSQTLDYLKGNNVNFDVSDTSSKEEAQAKVDAMRKTQEIARDALAFTAVALLNPPKITIFDFSKKCCEITSQPVFSGVPPELSIAFGVLSALMQAMIDGLDAEAVVNFLGVSSYNISASFVTTLFDSLISVIPNVSLPNPANLLLLIQAFLLPILTLISIPKAFNPLQPPMISISIPLDPILKPLLKGLISDMIAALFKLMSDAANSYKQSQNNSSNAGTNNIKVGENEQPIINTSNTNGIFATSDADQELAKQVFSAPCGMGTTMSIIINKNGTPVGQSITFTNADGTTSSTTDPVFEVQLTLEDGTVVRLLTLPLLALDLLGYFHLITGDDIIEFVRTLMNAVFDMVMAPLIAIVNALSALTLSLNSYNFNIIEAALPLIMILKLAKIALDSLIPHSAKLQLISGEIFNLLQVSVIPALELAEPILKEVAWIGAIALCSLSSPITMYKPVSIARLLHPIMNADDLPPWERLTHKNPLFAIFLDEIAWRGSIYATGSLIFQSKTPAVLPYTPTFPIIHVSPHLL